MCPCAMKSVFSVNYFRLFIEIGGRVCYNTAVILSEVTNMKRILCTILCLVLVLSAVSALADTKTEKPELITKASDFAVVIIAHDDTMAEVELDWGSAVEAHDFADFEALRDAFTENSTVTYDDIYGVEHGDIIVETPEGEPIPNELTYEDIYGVEHGEAIVESPAAEENPESLR